MYLTLKWLNSPNTLQTTSLHKYIKSHPISASFVPKEFQLFPPFRLDFLVKFSDGMNNRTKPSSKEAICKRGRLISWSDDFKFSEQMTENKRGAFEEAWLESLTGPDDNHGRDENGRLPVRSRHGPGYYFSTPPIPPLFLCGPLFWM